MSLWTNVIVGLQGEAREVVTPERTVGFRHPPMPMVYSTPSMLFLMETAAGDAIQPFLPEGWVSVGVDVHIRHLAATPVGATVTAWAKVTAVGEKLVTFDVEAHDGTNVIGRGSHTRAPIELARFQRAMTARLEQRP
ncbi:MAG: thioesterase [Gemmatimonadetes bacterium]|nr:thioesterase [Gemmatimonadota bacterium]MBI3568157.1 thioesterase [Gemmatimonadota bacterium]